MSIIEGVGDEVVWFLSLVLASLIALGAWWSTGYRHDRLRTVVVVDRHMRTIYRAFVQHPVTVNIRRGRNAVRESTEINNGSGTLQAQNTSSNLLQADAVDNVSNPDSESYDGSPRSTDVTDGGDLASTEQIAEMESIVNAMDSEANVIRNRRVAFFQQRNNTQTGDSLTNTNNVMPSATESAAQSLSQRLTKVMNDQTPMIPAESDEQNTEETIAPNIDDSHEGTPDISLSDAQPTVEDTPGAGDNIRIRLKYLNDDQKLVEASLQEQLGDFKRRHFSRELASRGGALVRLVFAGRLLREADTLRDAGLYDNCVVHCLINQPRNQQYQGADVLPQNLGFDDNMDAGQIPQPERSETPETAPNREWDLGHALFTLESMMLTVAWYCHFQYSHLFGGTASVALLVLTGLYGIAVVGAYYPDRIQSGERPAAQNAGEPASQR